ncbi:MAG: DUF3943 domain-containing protein [bacterium]|nr:DUF3943 domain-containing protein [bacterium]
MRKTLKTLYILLLMLVLHSSVMSSENGHHGKDPNSDEKKAARLPDLLHLGSPIPYLESPVRFYFKAMKLNMALLTDIYNLDLPLDRFNAPKPKSFLKAQKRWGRTIMEGVGHFIYATASYWVRQDVMKEDWEYQLTWADQKRRFLFLDGPRFDSNTFQFNWTHSFAGAIYYNYARTNRLNALESFAFSIGASTFWEFVIEFKEVVSINDMIGTPMGSLSIGEPMFQLSRVFRDQSPTFFSKLASFLSNPIMSLNNWLDRKKSIPKIYRGAADLWHDFRLHIGPNADKYNTDKSSMLVNLGVETQVVTVPEYGRNGSFSTYMGRTLFTRLDLDVFMDKGGIHQFDIFAKSILFGYYNQDIHEKDGEISGYAFILGGATAFDLRRKSNAIIVEDEAPVYNTDKLCVLNLLGPSLDITWFRKDLTMRFNADLFFDFGLVHSIAYPQYTALIDVSNTKSTLLNHGYYYALGFTAATQFQLNYGNVEFAGRLKYHYFNSIEGLDRFQKDMADEDDFPLRDKRLDYSVNLGYRIPGTDVQLVVGLEENYRRGWLGDFNRKHTETRTYFQVKYLF